jgi:hypothetical protein
MHRLVQSLAPEKSTFVSVQLIATERAWRDRFTSDPTRPAINEFFERRYLEADVTAVDHRVGTDDLDAPAVAEAVAAHLGW